MPRRKERVYYRWLMEEHNAHLKMSWIKYQVKQKDGVLMYPPPLFPPPPPSYSSHSSRDSSSPSTASSSSGSKISPAVLFVIVILAVLFFISGLLHLLVRFLIKHPSSSGSSHSNSRYPELSGPDALQRQLQQLFHLHDSGVDQAFIDALPVFNFKEIVGLKEPFDCAVCLCEFSEKDKLRLLPTCSHAFHVSCIDTWLLSNSTCPLCRGTLFAPGFSIENPMFDFDELREEDGCAGNVENGLASGHKTVEIEEEVVKKGVLPVRLGKFRRMNDEQLEVRGETSSSNLDTRRCFSMGSYQYVLGNSVRVSLCNDRRARGPLSVEGEFEGQKITSASKGESFSVSKIWLWPKKGKFSSSEPQTALPSSLNSDLSWMAKKQEQEQ